MAFDDHTLEYLAHELPLLPTGAPGSQGAHVPQAVDGPLHIQHLVRTLQLLRGEASSR